MEKKYSPRASSPESQKGRSARWRKVDKKWQETATDAATATTTRSLESSSLEGNRPGGGSFKRPGRNLRLFFFLADDIIGKFAGEISVIAEADGLF